MSQIFKKEFDIKPILHFLIKYCEKEKNKTEYVFSPISYKKAVFNKDIEPILETLNDSYHKSKRFYLTRNMTYKNFLTILRQVCNFICIPYTSKILYNSSKYNIIYILYLNDILIKNDIVNNNVNNNVNDNVN